jgi:hypothetical protein
MNLMSFTKNAFSEMFMSKEDAMKSTMEWFREILMKSPARATVEKDEIMTKSWEDFEAAHPQEYLDCDSCGRITRMVRLKNGICEKCRNFKLIQGGL